MSNIVIVDYGAGNLRSVSRAIAIQGYEPTISCEARAMDVMTTDDDEKRHWSSAAELAARLIPTLMHTPPGTVFNLNVPDLHLDGIRGLRRAALAQFGQVQMSIAEAGEGFVRTAVQAADELLEPQTDLAALAEHFAVVTPLRAPVEASDVRFNLETVAVHSPAL